MARAKKGSWIVRVKAEVIKEIVCEDCTEEQARDDPYEHMVDETETDTIHIRIESVRPNT